MKLTPEKVLRYLENYGKAICLLPLNQNSNKIISILNKIGFYFSTVNMSIMILCISLTAYIKSTEFISVTTLLSLIMLYFEVLSNTIVWRWRKCKFQGLLQGIYGFIKYMEVENKEIIQKYIARYKYYYVFQILFVCLAFILRTIITPILQPNKLLLAIWYPFIIEPFTFTYFFIFFLQLINIIHCSSQIIFPLIVAIIFLHISMKLEILAQDIHKVRSSDQLITCIQRHQDCIKMVENVNHVFGSMIVKTYFFTGLSIILGSIPIIYENNFFIIFRSGFTAISCLVGTYIYNGAADDLYETSQSVAVTLCGLEWNDELFKMRRSLLIMICRAQKPLSISPLDGLMPALTRKVYTSFLSYLVSYIMTLRAIVSSH